MHVVTQSAMRTRNIDRERRITSALHIGSWPPPG